MTVSYRVSFSCEVFAAAVSTSTLVHFFLIGYSTLLISLNERAKIYGTSETVQHTFAATNITNDDANVARAPCTSLHYVLPSLAANTVTDCER